MTESDPSPITSATMLVPLNPDVQQRALEAGRKAWRSSAAPELPAAGPLFRFACCLLAAAMIVVTVEQISRTAWRGDHQLTRKQVPPSRSDSLASVDLGDRPRVILPDSPPAHAHQDILRWRQQLKELLQNWQG